MTDRLPVPAPLRLRAVGVSAAAALACAAGLALDPDQFFRSWLVATTTWTSLALGCLALCLLLHLTRGAWGVVGRRPLEAGARTLPLLAVLFLPVLAGLPALYEWARPDAVAGDELLQHKAAWLDVDGYRIRTLACFAVWIGLATLVDRLGRREDAGDARATRLLRAWAGPGLVLHGLTSTVAAVDWLMSLEPRWQSSLYGFWFLTAQVLAALALLVVVAHALSRTGAGRGTYAARHFHDWGKLLLTFVLVWGYVTFSRLLLVWSADLPAEAAWYVRRSGTGWRIVATLLVVLHFAAPFLALLSRDVKRRAPRLAVVAALLLVMHGVDIYWQAAPAFRDGAFAPHWLDLAAMLAVGGAWVAAYVTALASRPLLPRGAPDLEEALRAH